MFVLLIDDVVDYCCKLKTFLIQICCYCIQVVGWFIQLNLML